MKRCRQCNKGYTEEINFCFHCGIPLEELTVINHIICSQCGIQNNPDFSFCKGCGHPLKEKNAIPVASRQERNDSVRSIVKKNGTNIPDSVPTEVAAKVPNQGKDLFNQYLNLAATGTGSPQERIELLSKTLDLGVPLKDEVFARISIGIQYAELDQPDQAIEWHDQALALAGNDEGIFNSTSLRILCRSVCAAYLRTSREIKSGKGIDFAISYLLSKEKLLKTLSAPVLYHELAVLYKERDPDDFDVISFYYKKVIDCEISDDLDQSCIQKAKDALEILRRLSDNLNLKIINNEVPKEQKSNYIPVVIAQPSTKDSKKKYTKIAIVSTTIILLFVAGFLLKSYLAKPVDQVVKDIVQKPQPINSQKLLEQPPPSKQLPMVDHSKEELPPASIEPGVTPAAEKNKALVTGRFIKDQKLIKKESVRKAKQQATTQTETLKDQELKMPYRESFAPHSRDDL